MARNTMHENKPETDTSANKNSQHEISSRCAIIIFGATGDLTKRKIIPAIYRLMASKKLSDFIIVGAAFEQATPEAIIKKATPFIPDLDTSILDDLQKRFYYQQLNFTDI